MTLSLCLLNARAASEKEFCLMWLARLKDLVSLLNHLGVRSRICHFQSSLDACSAGYELLVYWSTQPRKPFCKQAGFQRTTLLVN